MANALVRARVKEVWFVDNGDKDVEKPALDAKGLQKRIDEIKMLILSKEISDTRKAELRAELAEAHDALMSLDEDNVLQATLDFPRSGERSVTAFRAMALGDGQGNGKNFGPNPDFFKSVLFKEEIQGETELQVQVQDTDPRNPVLSFLRSVAATLFGNIAGGLVDGISHVVPSSAASVVSDRIKGGISPGDKKVKVHVIGESEKVRIQIDQAGNLQVSQLGPQDTFQNGILTLHLIAPRKVGTVGEGGPNGQVILLLDAETI